MNLLLVKLSTLCYFVYHIESKHYISHCRERERLICTEEQDLYEIVEVELGQTVKLYCKFCSENDDAVARLWAKASYFVNVLTPSKENLITNNKKFKIGTDSSLLIRNITADDSGLYMCRQSLDQAISETKYNYYIDVVWNVTAPYYGNVNGWKNYVKENMAKINEYFKNSSEFEYAYLRNVLGCIINVVSKWETRRPCDGCTGLMKRTAFCRLRIIHADKSKFNTLQNKANDEKKLLSTYQLSCHSIQFGKLFPKISNELRRVPNYAIVNQCTGPCNVSLLNETARYHNTYTLREGSFLILKCTNTTLKNNVLWRKNGFNLNSGNTKNQRVEVDIFGTLLLINVKNKDAGKYSCYVDNIYMQEITIDITPNSLIQSTDCTPMLNYGMEVVGECKVCER